ncbi:Peroxidase N1 [Vitis vinifera]|uniref:peroxidase n=1 Tax=Vitis vinifera TaxID=29760 RepID=A0A438CM30_VITVI|nr:Peroxidase N1 [Vitis vinifera]
MAAALVQGQGTRVGFYSRTCPPAESIVQKTVQSHFQSNPAIAPGLLRMHFHDCFVRGCDASILINGTSTEKTTVPNSLLNGYDVIDDAKTQLEAACPGVVSCADILALAARDSVVLTKGLRGKCLRDVEMGEFHWHLIYRLYNFSTTTANGADPSMDAKFVTQLQALCPSDGDGSKRIALDTGSPNRFDATFFTNLKNGRGVLESDQKLWTDASTRTFVQRFLGVRGLRGLNFNVEFGRSMVKMSNIGVKTGTEGEIRRVCTVIN